MTVAGQSSSTVTLPDTVHHLVKIMATSFGIKQYQLIAFLVIKMAMEIGIEVSKEAANFVTDSQEELRDLLDSGKIQSRVGESMLSKEDAERLFSMSLLK